MGANRLGYNAIQQLPSEGHVRNHVDRLALAAVHILDAAPRISLSPGQVVEVLTGRPAGIGQIVPWLRPGIWDIFFVRTGPFFRPIAAIRRDAQIPVHLNREALSGSTRWGLTEEKPLMQRRFALDRAERLGAFQADVWIIRHSKKLLLFDLDQKKTLRWESQEFSEDYAELRQRISAHIPSVTYSIGSSRHSIIESFAEGEPFSYLANERKIAVCRILLRGLAELVRSEVSHCRTEVKEPPSTAFNFLPQFFKGSPQAQNLTAIFGQNTPSIPVHGELNESSIFVSPLDKPIVIDFGGVSKGPFFADALRVASLLPDVWVEGGFDAELSEVWNAAGLPPVRWSMDNVQLGLVACAEATARRRMSQTRPPFRALKRFFKAAHIRSQWHQQSFTRS